MYNLLIVDDEPAVVNALADTIEWEEIGVIEVYKAYSGRRAYEFLHTYRVDIVILDIRMPGVSGLDLAKDIHERWPYSKVIMLSGYSEFEYAQEAIDFGVFRYLTKPTPREEIEEVVSSAIKKIEEEWEQFNKLEKAQSQLNEMLPILKERYLNAWVTQGQIEEKQIIKKLKACQVDIELEQPFFLILICIDEWKEESTDEEEGRKELVMKNLIKEVLLKKQAHIVFKDFEENYVVLVQAVDKKKLNTIMEYIEKMAVIFQSSVQRSLGWVVSVFWNKISENFQEIHGAYVSMITRNRRELLLTTGAIVGLDTEGKVQENKNINCLWATPSFSILIESNQRTKAIERIYKIFDEVEKKGIGSSQLLLEIYYMISGTILQECNRRGFDLKLWSEDQYLGFYNFEIFKSITQLKEWCINVTQAFMTYVERLEMNKGTYLIEQAKQIILEHLGEVLTLSEIAESLYIHPNYLSSLFKEQTGNSITDYEIKLKINKAQQLLGLPGIKVYEVAEMVGYESVPSFNRIFRRIVGVTPKEYQSGLL